jgi:RND family efflux transporter MFP subunit
MKKTILVVFVLAVFGFLGWKLFEKSGGPGGDSPRMRSNAPVAVEVAAVTRTTIEDIREFSGTLTPLSRFILAPKIAGRLEKIEVNIGETLAGGQLVAVLEDEELRQQVDQDRAELEVARANLQERLTTLENAKRELERTVTLRQKKIASESELDTAESEYKTQQAKLQVATAQVTQKEAALKMAQVRLSYARILVPENHASGDRVVGERFVDEGAMLAPNTPIVSILDIGSLIAVIHVIERDYPRIRPGLQAMVSTDAYPGRSFTGRVIRIAPLLKETSREARVEIEIPNEQQLLKPGMFVRVRIRFDRRENAVVVPAAALTKRNGVQGIFVADLQSRTARFLPVTVGIVSGAGIEVTDPALSGAVVTLGHHLLEDGSAILVPESNAAGAGPQTDLTPAEIPVGKPEGGEPS